MPAQRPARPYTFTTTGDRYGWVAGEDGTAQLTLHVQAGRVADTDTSRLRTALREVARIHRGDFRLTGNQNFLIAQVKPTERASIEAILDAHNVIQANGGLRQAALSCVALPTCGLALAEAERFLPDLLTLLEPALAAAGLENDDIVLRMTGCPNGCARPYMAEIALVGRAPNRYHLYLGGAYEGTRLNKLFRADLDPPAIQAALAPLFAQYAQDRREGERFGDWTIRAGHIKPTLAGREFHADVVA